MGIRDSSSFLLKKRGVKKPFSTEPCNLTNRNAQRYNGLVNNKVVGISAAPDNKGFVLTTKRSKNAFRPAKAMVATTMKAGPRRSLHKVKAVLNKQIQEGPDQGCHAPCCSHRQITESFAGQKGSEGPSQEGININVHLLSFRWK